MSVKYKVVTFPNDPWTDIETRLNEQGTNQWDLQELRNQTAVFRSRNHIATAVSAFGEPISVTLTPVVQLDAIYGITSNDYEVFNNGDGEIEATGSLFYAHSGTGSGAYGVVRSKRLIRYRAGQGALARFTAGYTTPHANTIQRAGLFAQEQGLFIGYEATNFGVTRQNGGKAIIYKLLVTAPAGGSETATVQLNGTNYNINLISGNESSVASQIAASSSAFLGQHTIEAISSSVCFLSTSVGVKTGVNSFSSSTAAGSVTIAQSGSANVLTFVSQSNFNVDTLDGSGPSGMTLDPSKLNVYQINFRWLGAGEMRYAIENQESGDMIFFHHEHYTNQNTIPHLDNPSFKIGYIAANVSAETSTDVHTYGASMLGAIEGQVKITGYPTAVSANQASLSANDNHHLISLRNNLIYKNKINLRLVIPKQISVAYNGNDTAILSMYLNSHNTGFDTRHIFNSVGSDNNSSTSVVAGEYTNLPAALAIFTIPADGNLLIDLDSLNISLSPADQLNFTIQSTGVITKATAALTYTEF